MRYQGWPWLRKPPVDDQALVEAELNPSLWSLAFESQNKRLNYRLSQAVVGDQPSRVGWPFHLLANDAAPVLPDAPVKRASPCLGLVVLLEWRLWRFSKQVLPRSQGRAVIWRTAFMRVGPAYPDSGQNFETQPCLHRANVQHESPPEG